MASGHPQVSPRYSKLAALMDNAESDIMTYLAAHLRVPHIVKCSTVCNHRHW